MAYLNFRQEPALGYVGCGAGCGCAPCRQKANLGFVGLPTAPAQQAGPKIRFECPTVCGPTAGAAQCLKDTGSRVSALSQAVIEAIKMANNAANKLTANPRDQNTVDLFRSFFGHDPSLPVSWAGNQQSGISVAGRFRAVAAELQGRGILYSCIKCGSSTTKVCPPGAPTLACQINARAVRPNKIQLCERFWTKSRARQAGILIHAMLHVLFGEFIIHNGSERRRNNAHCYEAFALKVAAHGTSQCMVCQCQRRPV